MAPRYRDVKAEQIPEVEAGGGTRIKIIAGRVGNTQGPVRDIVTDPEYLDITVPSFTTYCHPTEKGHTVLAYVIEGSGCFCREKKPFTFEVDGANYFDMETGPFIGNCGLVLFEDGDVIEVSTESEPVRFLLISGRPIGEPVAWRGPIVMNTREELEIAFEEYSNGSFIKQRTPDVEVGGKSDQL
jgi:redox-sensitive bicupin YhaK (pirin superfamily)